MFRVHHVSLSVSDVERSERFYSNLLGFSRVHNWQSEDGSLVIRHLRLESVILELFCFKDCRPLPPHAQALEDDLPTLGTKHFGLVADDIGQAAASISAKGYPGTIAIKDGRTGIRYFFVSDPDGILIEIVEDKRAI